MSDEMNEELELVARLERGVAGSQEALEAKLGSLLAVERASAADLIDDVVRAAQAGSDPAMDVLLRTIAQHRLVHAPIRKYLINEADIDDVEQAVLATVATKLDKFEGKSRFTTWLYRVASNEALMLVRSRSRRPNASEELGEEDYKAGYIARVSSMVANRDAVDAAVQALDEIYRVPLLLREYEQLDYQEIANRLDIPVGTVRSRLNRARKDVAELLRAGGLGH